MSGPGVFLTCWQWLCLRGEWFCLPGGRSSWLHRHRCHSRGCWATGRWLYFASVDSDCCRAATSGQLAGRRKQHMLCKCSCQGKESAVPGHSWPWVCTANRSHLTPWHGRPRVLSAGCPCPWPGLPQLQTNTCLQQPPMGQGTSQLREDQKNSQTESKPDLTQDAQRRTAPVLGPQGRRSQGGAGPAPAAGAGQHPAGQHSPVAPQVPVASGRDPGPTQAAALLRQLLQAQVGPSCD